MIAMGTMSSVDAPRPGAESVVGAATAAMGSNEYSLAVKDKNYTIWCLIPIGMILFLTKIGREWTRFCVMIVIQVEKHNDLLNE